METKQSKALVELVADDVLVAMDQGFAEAIPRWPKLCRSRRHRGAPVKSRNRTVEKWLRLAMKAWFKDEGRPE
jgi:hypothetical protein